MGNWIIKWKFNKTSYAPGELAQVDFWLENTDNSNLLFVSELEMDFDFGSYKLEQPVSGMILPRKESFLGSVNFLLPITVVGIRKFRPKYRIYENINNNWFNHGLFMPEIQYFIGVFPTPFYRIFVSRGRSIDDKSIGNPIVEILRQWSRRSTNMQHIKQSHKTFVC